MAKETAPAHPSDRTLLGSSDQEILDVTEQVYQVEYMLVPSELPSLVTKRIHGGATSRSELMHG